MKKMMSALLTIAITGMLAITVFASDSLLGPQSIACANCGKRSVTIQKIVEYEAGPEQETCIHRTAGTDEVYYIYGLFQEKCNSCGYLSTAWNTKLKESKRVCHGW